MSVEITLIRALQP